MFKLLLIVCCVATSAKTELAGRVVDADGNPVANAIVVVSTARPRVGPATTCPSCYRDCAKRTLTDREGKFTIGGLSDALQFSLAAGAPGFQGAVSEHFDPQDSESIQLSLRAFPTGDGVVKIRGRVVDLQGMPIAGAELRPRTVQRNDGRIGGQNPSVTSLTLSDDNGEFELSAGNRIVAFDVRALANGFAPKDVSWSRSDNEALEIRLGTGASLRGRLVYQGRGTPNVEVGLVQKDRTLGNIVTPQEVFTDSSGEFRFDQLPPNLEYTLYTHTGQDAPAVLPVSLVTAPKHGERAQLGDIALTKPSQLTLVFETSDARPLPKDSYVVITRRYAWRSSRVVLDQKAVAEAVFNDVPNESFDIIVRAPGYTVASTSPPSNLDMNRRYSIRVRGETRMEFLMKPAEPSNSSR